MEVRPDGAAVVSLVRGMIIAKSAGQSGNGSDLNIAESAKVAGLAQPEILKVCFAESYGLAAGSGVGQAVAGAGGNHNGDSAAGDLDAARVGNGIAGAPCACRVNLEIEMAQIAHSIESVACISEESGNRCGVTGECNIVVPHIGGGIVGDTLADQLIS